MDVVGTVPTSSLAFLTHHYQAILSYSKGICTLDFQTRRHIEVPDISICCRAPTTENILLLCAIAIRSLHRRCLVVALYILLFVENGTIAFSSFLDFTRFPITFIMLQLPKVGDVQWKTLLASHSAPKDICLRHSHLQRCYDVVWPDEEPQRGSRLNCALMPSLYILQFLTLYCNDLDSDRNQKTEGRLYPSIFDRCMGA